MTLLELPGMRAAPPNQPATFAERGTAVPFTTPLLGGARLRAAPSGRAGGAMMPELVMLNPSGARGHYIVPWDSVRQLARPTVHDIRLFDAILAGAEYSPGGIALAARGVAADGFAGRAARAAARAAVSAEQALQVQCSFRLLLYLVRQEDGRRPGALPPEQETLAALHGRARTVIAALTTRLALRAPVIAQALETLGGCVMRLGIAGAAAPDASAGRFGRLIAALDTLQADANGFAAQLPAAKGQEPALVGAIARVTAAGGRHLIGSAIAALGDLSSLIARTAAHPAAVAAELARAEWLLDGWDQLCALHAGAPGARKGAVFQEIAAHAPMIPSEAVGWVGLPSDIEAVTRMRRGLPAAVPAGTGIGSLDVIARNEHLRAVCLALASGGTAPVAEAA